MKHITLIIVAMFFCGVFLASHATMAIAGGKIGVIVVDVQGDFTTLKNGSLACGGTDKAYVDKVEDATKALSKRGTLSSPPRTGIQQTICRFFRTIPGKSPLKP